MFMRLCSSSFSSSFLRSLPLIFIDALIVVLSVWLSFWLRLAQPFHPAFLAVSYWLLPSALLIGLPLYARTGQYKGIARYEGGRSLYYFAGRNGFLVLLLAAVGVMCRFPMPPRSSWVLLWLLLTCFTGASRFVLRDLLLSLTSLSKNRVDRVAIYGAGDAGAQLLAALRLTGNYQIITFLDDSPTLWRRTINGYQIRPPQELSSFSDQLDHILLAIPSLSRLDRRRIISDLQKYSIPVLQIPSVDELTSGKARIDTLRPISIEDLLGRDPVSPVPQLLGPGIRESVVCVTGAGGSIGSELCRQILKLSPATLILLERSEPSLYALDQELRRHAPSGLKLVPVLGNAADSAFVKSLFISHQVQTVFHAAAYKHVPLVEANPLAGIANNVISTLSVCRAALDAGVNELVLISTDKAVRPTNVMGASKRLAELVLQAIALESSHILDSVGVPRTRFAMVRFGNVLGSSGSVVPLFRRQISDGGPITLTHPEIIRYFMTIPEAAQLVLQAATLAKGGDLFLLDMGEPVRIKELAEHMVHLSGLSVRNTLNPDGDIDIICTGLRPGEKLYEELLIDAESQPTSHPLIFRAQEQFLSPEVLWPRLSAMEDSMSKQDVESTLAILSELVPEWRRSS